MRNFLPALVGFLTCSTLALSGVVVWLVTERNEQQRRIDSLSESVAHYDPALREVLAFAKEHDQLQKRVQDLSRAIALKAAVGE